MSLLFPAYLLGLLGLAFPWILHRFSDQQPPEQLFPSRQFLEPTTPPVSRRRTLRYRALLALRVLAFMLLCLLFAQPFIKKGNLPLTQQMHHMIVVDQSLSMRAEGRWSSAQEKAGQLIAEFSEGSAQLIGFDKRVRVHATVGQSQEGGEVSMTDALSELQPGYTPADYGLLMQRIDRLAAEQELPVKLWLVTDMQQSALPAQLNALYAPNVTELEFVTVDSSDAVNVHLVAAAESANDATASVSVSLLASIDSLETPAEPIARTLRLEAAGELLEQRSVMLTPGKLSVMIFDDLVLPAQSDPYFTVSLLEPDALMEDNRQQLPIIQQQPTGVVLLNSPEEPLGSPSVFVTTALETDGMSLVEPIRGTPLQIPPDTPHLVTGRNLTEAIEQDLLQFVDADSNALVFNQVATQDGTLAPLEGAGIGVMDEAHPLALGDIQWLGTEFYDLPELAVEKGDRVLLQTSQGQSVLVERATNRGRLLLLNDPLDGLASNLPLQPSFVSLMQSMLRYFDASTSVPQQVVIGDRLALPANVQVIDSSGEALLDLADAARASTVELETPGLYTVVSVRGEQSLRAVLDAEESDLSRLSAPDIAAWQSRYADGAALENDAELANASSARKLSLPANSEHERQNLWKWLLPLSAMLLLAEGWFANRRLDVRRDGS